MKIIIAGTGGVGGYFGGLLARRYADHRGIEVHFIARGKHLEMIRAHGLQVHEHGKTFTAHPSSASETPGDIGPVDVILLCVKSYDLESVLEIFKPCVDDNTIVLPLLNGVDSVPRVKHVFPHTRVWHGFTYIVARLTQPGVVENIGNIQKLFFGIDNIATDEMRRFEFILNDAGIEATLSEDISRLMWEKFIFISPLATITSYLDKNRGQIMENEKDMSFLLQLIDEIIAVARALKINLYEDIRDKTLAKLHSLTRDTTSSMHHDFTYGNRTELETLTGYVVRQGRGLNVPTPGYTLMYEKLLNIEYGVGNQ